VVAEAVPSPQGFQTKGEGAAIAVIVPPARPAAAAAGSHAHPVPQVTKSPVSGRVSAPPATATPPIIPACHARARPKAHPSGIVALVAIPPAAPAAPAVAPEAFPQAPHPLAIATTPFAEVDGRIAT